VVCDDGSAVIARGVVLATGGAAALWSRTTNPPGSFGSGLLLARAAGATLADLEFVQFHPTAVTGIPGREGFLATEALRGEGATLHDHTGERFVDELAPRDEVARAIRRTMDATGQPHVHLDMRSVDPGRFPNVVKTLRDAGLDPMTEMEVLTVGDAVHQALKRGDVEAVGIGCHDYEEFMAEEGDPSQFRLLAEGPVLPPDLLMARQGADPAMIETVRSTFVDHFDTLLPAMLEGKDNAKYDNAELVTVTDADYDVVRSMYRAIGANDFSDFVGN
jgi:hypothetical protein